MNTYVIVIERAEDGGYGAYAPDVPGVIALADTVEATIEEMREAIEFHLEGLVQDGLPIPNPNAVIATTITTSAA